MKVLLLLLLVGCMGTPLEERQARKWDRELERDLAREEAALCGAAGGVLMRTSRRDEYTCVDRSILDDIRRAMQL